MCAGGVSIKIEDFGGLMYNRFVVIGANGTDPVVVTGSMNWTASGGDADDENTLIIHDAETAQSYLATFQALYGALGPETLCKAYWTFLPLVLGGASGSVPADVRITYVEYNPPGGRPSKRVRAHREYWGTGRT